MITEDQINHIVDIIVKNVNTEKIYCLDLMRMMTL